MHSGRPIFIYGPAGAGKTYVASRLANLFDDTILVPHAIAIGETVIQFFDPVYHKRVENSEDARHMMLDHGHDPRYLNCYRPMVMTGGELTLDMLELTYDAGTRRYHAPLQLKANNGVCMIDDLGRQRVQPVDLLNRWIVPMEERRDFLALGSGEHFPIPFEVVLIFSTNLDPLDLADEAFLRRLGYKIRFDYLDENEFTQIWRQVCEARGLDFDQALLNTLFERHYRTEQRPMLPCHPRDLIGLARDLAVYNGKGDVIGSAELDAAWASYFVKPVATHL
jgi:SpoVK/Ycf46/Vps4 family AAA+-type ATPase